MGVVETTTTVIKVKKETEVLVVGSLARHVLS